MTKAKRNILVTHAERVEFGTTTKDKKQKKICETCGSEMKCSRKLRKWICEQCLYGAFLTDQAQREAVRRYRQTEKGKESERKYELSEKGKTARERYLKSDKYKEARKRYNQRLKESLAIARQAELERAKALTEAEAKLEDERASIIQDIREFIDTMGRLPTIASVKTLAKEQDIKLTDEQAHELIRRAQQH